MTNVLLKKYRNLDETQQFAILIPILFLLSGIIHKLVSRFRGSGEFLWLFASVSTITLFLSCFLILFSLVNSILIIRDLRMKIVHKILWILLSLSVFLYMALMFLIA
ncbi:hypothetical protein D3C84_696970 [compost metagenome]